VDRMSACRALTHIRDEAGEPRLTALSSSPSQTHLDTPAPVTIEFIGLLVFASGTHRCPYAILARSTGCGLVFGKEDDIISLGFAHGIDDVDSSEDHAAATGGPCAFIMAETTSKSTGRIQW
jgi:hypothetical protein